MFINIIITFTQILFLTMFINRQLFTLPLNDKEYQIVQVPLFRLSDKELNVMSQKKDVRIMIWYLGPHL